MGTIELSIAGVTKEIHRRENQLRLRKCWYVNGQSTPYQFTPYSFYFTGYRLMKEIEKLKRIREDLSTINLLVICA